ncbi:MAG: serine hydrolase [Rhodanobacteraceae bacterium]|nr:serine hydrolase [Xanthomonadales bacterium]MCP5478449.1 serine hydrolase [Rhodanobacteraceae bacterium]HPF72504.1 serine hydrolase [Xanthomonadaceae bacterium]HRX98677.1 serine hydrolase [Xanthomonadaceae bacterium]
MRGLTSILAATLCALAAPVLAGPAAAPPGIYRSSFEWDTVEPRFGDPLNGFALPSGPTTNQLPWVLQQLSETSTSTADINAHFHPGFLAQTSATSLQNFFQTLRTTYPGAELIDVVSVTPVRIVVAIQSPGETSPKGLLQLGADYTGSQLITYFSVGSFGNLQYAEDQGLDLGQAADKFATLSGGPGLLVARVGLSGKCEAIEARSPTTPRATASIFKTWVLGGVADAVASGSAALNDPIPLVASEIAPGGTINGENLGDPFSLLDMAILMLGISDNTATDHLHQWVGRETIESYIAASGTAHPDLLLPLLSINEQFHLFFSFPLVTSQGYVNGSESFQRDFLDSQIVPLGPVTSYPYSNESLFISGSWQASPMDVCNNLAHMRTSTPAGDASALVDAALGASAGQPGIRNAWDRVWYKGGNLRSGVNGDLVLTHAWLLERSGEAPYALIAMSNNAGGNIDAYKVQSITNRILQLMAAMP